MPTLRSRLRHHHPVCGCCRKDVDKAEYNLNFEWRRWMNDFKKKSANKGRGQAPLRFPWAQLLSKITMGSRATDRTVGEWMDQRVFVAWYNVKHGISKKSTEEALTKWRALADNKNIKTKLEGGIPMLLVNKEQLVFQDRYGEFAQEVKKGNKPEHNVSEGRIDDIEAQLGHEHPEWTSQMFNDLAAGITGTIIL